MNKMVLRLINFYQLYISKALGNNCRYIPTCSHYAKEAYQKHRFLYASFISIRRILSCHPFSKGGFDPVPEPKQKTSCRETNKRSE